jgi:uncharacterized membrane protein YedE/YeeE
MEWLYKPWPWYIAGPIIGLTVSALLLLGNKKLGISSTLRQLCAMCYPAKIPFLNYDWKKDSWNLYFVAGIIVGGFIGGKLLANPQPVAVAESTAQYFATYGIDNTQGLMPRSLFSWQTLFSLKGFLLMIVGGILVGFGTRYARGCTSGHGIMGLSSLQWTSLVATASFFIGGILVNRFVLPYILAL